MLLVRSSRPQRMRMTPSLSAHIFTIVVLAAWGSASIALPPYVLPSPFSVATCIFDLVTRPEYIRHGLYSLFHALTALTVAFLTGLALATTAHYVRTTRLLIHERVNRLMNSFSALGWIFLGIIWFGVNDFTVIFAMTVVVLPLVVVNLREGFLQLDQEIVEMARSFGRFPFRLYIKITLPLLRPYIAATLRIGYGVAWIISLTAELFAGGSGYGYILNRARMEFRLDMIFAIIFVIIFIVYTTERLVWIPLQKRWTRQYASR